MPKSLFLDRNSGFQSQHAVDRNRAANNSTFAITAVPPCVRDFGAASAGSDLPLATLLEFARSALSRDVRAAAEYLARAIAILQLESRHDPDVLPPLKTRTRGGMTRWQINRITEYVDANIASAIKATDLAALVRLSASHFFRAFKDSFGETPLTYVARRRMARAQQMMLSPDEPLAQIALSCGLCDQSHFTRVFRRVVGTSPHAWRREHAGLPDHAVDRICH